MEHIDISIKKNCFLKKLHRRTKSNYDNRIENNLSKTDKIDKEFQTFPHQKTLQKNASSTFEFQNKEISPDTDQKIKKLIESKHNESNKKEIFIEKLDLTAEEMIINQKKSDLLTNNSAIFEFGKKKQIDLFYAKGLETSKSSNFEEKISEIKQKYKITDDENNNFFVITEQNNEIEDVIRRDSFKNKLPNNFFPNKVKSFLEKDVQREKNEFITNENQKISHQKTISLVLTRQNLNKLNNNFIPNFYNNNSSSPEQANVMKLMQNLEKRVLFLENQVISLKNENLKLLKTSQMFEKTLEQFTQENNSKITNAIIFEKKILELEGIIKKTQDSFNAIQKNVKSHIVDDPLLDSLSSEIKNHILNKEKEDFQMRGINHNNEETNLNSIKKQSNNLILTSNNMNNHNFALRKSSDSTLTKSSNNFFDKTSHKNEVESSLSDYILKKGGKIMNNMAQKKIFLTPKGAVIFFKISFVF